MEHEIVVRGFGEVRALPDRAVVDVGVGDEGPSREEAYEATARLAADVDAVLAAEADAIERVVTAALVVQPRTRYRKGETVQTGWRASRTSTVEVVALDGFGGLLAQVVAAGGAISGLSWELASGNSAYDQARHRAAADARRRADAYAASLGVIVGSVAWVAEPGLRLGASEAMYGPRSESYAASAPMPSDDTIDISVAEITVRAAVEVGFIINDT